MIQLIMMSLESASVLEELLCVIFVELCMKNGTVYCTMYNCFLAPSFMILFSLIKGALNKVCVVQQCALYLIWLLIFCSTLLWVECHDSAVSM